jgi:hypothetical protein
MRDAENAPTISPQRVVLERQIAAFSMLGTPRDTAAPSSRQNGWRTNIEDGRVIKPAQRAVPPDTGRNLFVGFVSVILTVER